jgi:hypothetical protein
MDACVPQQQRLYGYDLVDVKITGHKLGELKVEFVNRAELPTAAEIEHRYDHSKHPNPMLEAVDG